MDPRLLEYYNRELQHLRELGGEFAREFPKIAGRLGLEGSSAPIPTSSGLLEGFSFLAGRVQLKMDDEFPRFTQHLLEIVYPHYLAPTPSMLVALLSARSDRGRARTGFVIPRDSQLHSQLGKGDQTPCEYRTAHDDAVATGTDRGPMTPARNRWRSSDLPDLARFAPVSGYVYARRCQACSSTSWHWPSCRCTAR